ncbi:MAG: hypothetical protein H8E27_12585 [Verrucomicrobia subdivision 3 bacterium]|nr:hypothetical protein [Limisphaerales bacterium]
MKLKQLIKHTTCMAALCAFMVGCGSDADEGDDPMANEKPPTPGEGPDGAGGGEGAGTGTEGN